MKVFQDVFLIMLSQAFESLVSLMTVIRHKWPDKGLAAKVFTALEVLYLKDFPSSNPFLPSKLSFVLEWRKSDYCKFIDVHVEGLVGSSMSIAKQHK